ncbi:MmgE/PrpD family protein [Metallumcola ferriviriculae]|uniref:MmgE/PrpD family protein n=1 Tax=Metallumcola ferriviriculae TaxID=3039180 RepID=A0AAU0UJB4_9FIRM|nr:MmgE/PrpD family protein [Desulfitibacteraceae bacterium MK1]
MQTKVLVDNILNTRYEDIPVEVIEHAKKSILNWMGVAIGAAYHPSVDMVLELKKDLNSGEQVSVFGRSERVDLLLATLINGMSSHIFDFDDTHLDTINHPSAPVAPVVFALGEWYDVSPKKLLKAFILGVEAELRIGNVVYPSHYDLGWHITSTTGVFGAATAAGILLDLDAEELLNAFGIAGTQASGLREMFGTMTKPFHPGKAAQNGLLGALLAKKGFTSSKQVLEAKRGFASVLATEYDLSRLNENWGKQWELLKNSFKPYACGIVLHPSIDACIKLREYAKPEVVKQIEVNVNPYVLELTGKPTPKTGLEGKFSIYHSATIGFLEGNAGEDQYQDEVVLRPDVVSFRAKIKPRVNSNLREDEAVAKIIFNDGSEKSVTVTHATGSINNPMTQERLNLKFSQLTHKILDEETIERLIKKVMDFENVVTVKEVINLSTVSQ